MDNSACLPPEPFASNCSESSEQKIKKASSERVRLWREKIKADPKLYAEAKEKERLRGIQRRASGKIQKVSDMLPREQKQFREKNHTAKAKERCRKQSANKDGPKCRKAENRLRRKIIDLERKLKAKNKLIIKFRRQNNEKKKKEREREFTEEKKFAPIIRAKSIMEQGDAVVLERLSFGEALVEQLQSKKKEMKTETERSIFAQVISGKIF